MINSKTKEYISNNLEKDVSWLALHSAKDSDVDMRMAIQQIEGRQKAKHKLPELFMLDDIIYPQRISIEQCSSSASASYKASLFSGETFADLSGGFGVDTFFFSKQFKNGIYVEPNEELCTIFDYNSKILKINNVSIVNSNLENFIDSLNRVDFIYIDPSRRDNYGKRVYEIHDLTPNVLLFKDKLLSKSKHLMIKLSPMLDITALKRQLPEIYELHVVAVNDECKELLCVLDKDNKNADFQIVTKNIKANSEETYIGKYLRERALKPLFVSEIEQFLYEPNAALMKSNLYNSLCYDFGVKKLARETNLFTNSYPIENFPGRSFKVLNIIPYQPKKIRKELKHIKSASITVRNFTISAMELRKSLKIKEGDKIFIFGTTLSSNNRVIIVCEKL